jgi:UDP-glucuronate 4-epimerase
MTILVTGAAGFIGSALTSRLLQRGDFVVGVDNHSNYYDPILKEARIARYSNHVNYNHYRVDISDKDAIEQIFKLHKPSFVINLAAQVGVRYSCEKPLEYIQSNVVGFANILESCRHHNVKHLVYASSSSVYGANSSMPFSVHHNVDHPLSLYAASKKSNELMAHAYSHLYNLPTTGLRFFTVYGPWGRPDMALFKFTNAILTDQPISLFNYGKHRRDFTYIDDLIEGILRILDVPALENPLWRAGNPDPASSSAPWRIYNIGNSKPEELLDYVAAIERALGKSANINLLPLQAGDVIDTYADVSELIEQFDYRPTTHIDVGVKNFVEWYLSEYIKNS